MKKRMKKRTRPSQTQRPRPQLDIGELTEIYGGRKLQDEGTKGGDSV